ncbi:hypothetical protein JS44_00875 [Anoxybacillus flavithermus]|uniref:Uncharacterized protein n=1 Tax=Anoxybacillus flavithermus TaxID=33934 RepID=A0A094J3D8_9BACL|nr:hypothetical protein JS44_00875 [Anoxybacillus flavithermus]
MKQVEQNPLGASPSGEIMFRYDIPLSLLALFCIPLFHFFYRITEIFRMQRFCSGLFCFERFSSVSS